MFKTKFEIFDNAPMAIVIIKQTEILYANPEFADMYHYNNPDEIIGKSIKKFQPPDLRDKLEKVGMKRERGINLVQTYESTGLRKNGSTFPIRVNAFQIELSRGPAVCGFIEDITEEKMKEKTQQNIQTNLEKKLDNKNKTLQQIQKELILENKKYQTLLESSPIGIAGHNGRKFEFINSTLVDLLGYDKKEELLDQPIFKIISDSEKSEVKQRIKHREKNNGEKGTDETYESKLMTKDGRKIPVLVKVTTIDFPQQGDLHFVFLMDITKRKELEREKEKIKAQVDKEERMNMVGQMAGGIAHDFNNQLTGILANAELFKMTYQGDDEGIEQIDEIIKSAKRATTLTEQLLTISREKTTEYGIIDIQTTISDVINMCDRIFSKNIKINIDMDDQEHMIRGDEGQLFNSILNIFLNARDAMPEGGEINVRTSIDTFTADDLNQLGYQIEPGRYIWLTVEDTGIGMDQSMLAKIFDPFYTTKDSGTGLGLSRAYGIIRNHDGWIDVSSQPKEGTVFSIYLPIEEDDDRKEKSSKEVILERDYTCLVIDDDQNIRKAVKGFLEQEGYTVIASGDPVDGVEYYRENYENIDLIMLDVNMKSLNGWEVISRLKKINSNLDDVILMTGSIELEDEKITQYQQFIAEVLRKPFEQDELIKTIKNTMETS